MLLARRRFWKRFLRPAGWLACVVVLRCFPPPNGPPSDPQQLLTVQRVIDGDTFILEGGHRVRMFGIDTPELARNGKPAESGSEAARDFLKMSVEGREVSLGFDQELFDKYGRRLAYVYVRGALINEEVVRAGYSRAKTEFPLNAAMKFRLRRAEREAQEQGRGLWSNNGVPTADPLTGSEVFEDE